MEHEAALTTLVEKSLLLEKYALGQLISLFEKEAGTSQEAEILTEKKSFVIILLKKNKRERAFIAGITGPPGVGKSTLVGSLAIQLIDVDKSATVAILAVDPSSHISGGALLGDRTRVQSPLNEKRIFFRSQASELNLGGIGRFTFDVADLLSHIFSYLIIETVGIGQNEIEVRQLADKAFLVVQPFSGDQIQFLKAGIMEVPDAFIINKCDQESLANKSFYQLKSSLGFLNRDNDLPAIFMTSATSGRGIKEVVKYLMAIKNDKKSFSEKANYFILKKVQQHFGELGLQIMKKNALQYNVEVGYYLSLDAILHSIKEVIGAFNQETE